MKTIIFLILTLLSSNVFSGSGYANGKVEFIRLHNDDKHPEWKPPAFWFTISGISKAGKCGAWRGKILFAMDTEQAYLMVLGALMAGKDLSVMWDDTQRVTSANYCKPMFVTIGTPSSS